jgi:glucokinase
MTENTWGIGIDLGGTKIEVAGVDSTGSIFKRMRRDTDVAGGPDSVEADIIAAVQEIMKSSDSRPGGIGVGMAGQIDPATGMVIFAPNLDWHNVPLQDVLSRKLGLPVVVTNDVRAAAWGEWMYGAGRGYNDIVCVFVGTGVGGGIVSGGTMLEGCSNTAGEIGHMTIDINGPACHCPNHGCLESLAGGWAIARDAQDAVARDPSAGAAMIRLAGGDAKSITAKIVSAAVHQGDALASKIFDGAADALVAGSVSLVNAFNPCMLILGGGVVEGMPELVSIVDRGVHGRALGAASLNLKVILSGLHNDAGVIGAAAYAMHLLSGKGDKGCV